MTMKEAPRQQEPRVILKPNGDGAYIAMHPVHLIRFLLDDGRTVDVWAENPSSDVSAAVLKETGASRICGHTILRTESNRYP